jgi:hypothetical protein
MKEREREGRFNVPLRLLVEPATVCRQPTHQTRRRSGHDDGSPSFPSQGPTRASRSWTHVSLSPGRRFPLRPFEGSYGRVSGPLSSLSARGNEQTSGEECGAAGWANTITITNDNNLKTNQV